jgi:hypothetical protein
MQNNIGYYSVGNQTTLSKLEAIDYHGHYGLPIQWHFNDHVFKQIDWTKEPPGTLKFWYAERARQLREKYDYLLLYYSGGADSYNVLNSFIENNIFIDEIVQFHTLSGNHGDKTSLSNREVFFTSAPFTKQLIENNPIYKHTKHRLVDITEYETHVMLDKKNKWDFWYLSPNYSPHCYVFCSVIQSKIREWDNLLNQGNRMCMIEGVDKPNVRQDNSGSYWADFTDGVVGTLPPPGWALEYFYWSPDLPALPIKQAHHVKNYLKNQINQDVDNYHVFSGDIKRDEYGRCNPDIQSLSSVKKNGKTYHLTEHGLHRIIYPTWNSKSVVCPKSPSKIFSIRDSWFLDKNAPDFGQRYYLREMVHVREKIKKINPSLWWEFKFDPKIGPYNGGITTFKNSYKLD